MAPTLPVGPYKTVALGGDAPPAPWYIIPFDKKGRTTAPLTTEHLVREVKSGAYTDLFLFSHGWNNDWDAASGRYEDFISKFIAMRAQYALPRPEGYRPLLVGIFWPSTALVLPWERAPRFAATDGAAPSAADADVAAAQRELEELAAELPDERRATLYRLTQRERLGPDEATELAQLLAEAARGWSETHGDGGDGDQVPVTADELLARARNVPGEPPRRRRAPGEFGFADDGGIPARGPAAAFDLGDLDPRNLVRVTTVMQMKDRAGVVGRDGVGPLLHDLGVANEQVRIHLIGHSYGCIVVLSALAADVNANLRVQSVLLLQPAVSQWCFAKQIPGTNRPGGYRKALDRVKGPVFTTYTRNDDALTKFFHLALRRDVDRGQPRSAAGGDALELPEPPSRYAALGGFGPRGLDPAEIEIVRMTMPPTPYTWKPTPKVWALNGDATITGHGDISVPATWWALYQLIEERPATS